MDGRAELACEGPAGITSTARNLAGKLPTASPALDSAATEGHQGTRHTALSEACPNLVLDTCGEALDCSPEPACPGRQAAYGRWREGSTASKTPVVQTWPAERAQGTCSHWPGTTIAGPVSGGALQRHPG